MNIGVYVIKTLLIYDDLTDSYKLRDRALSPETLYKIAFNTMIEESGDPSRKKESFPPAAKRLLSSGVIHKSKHGNYFIKDLEGALEYLESKKVLTAIDEDSFNNDMITNDIQISSDSRIKAIPSGGICQNSIVGYGMISNDIQKRRKPLRKPTLKANNAGTNGNDMGCYSEKQDMPYNDLFKPQIIHKTRLHKNDIGNNANSSITPRIKGDMPNLPECLNQIIWWRLSNFKISFSLISSIDLQWKRIIPMGGGWSQKKVYDKRMGITLTMKKKVYELQISPTRLEGEDPEDIWLRGWKKTLIFMEALKRKYGDFCGLGVPDRKNLEYERWDPETSKWFKVGNQGRTIKYPHPDNPNLLGYMDGTHDLAGIHKEPAIGFNEAVAAKAHDLKPPGVVPQYDRHPNPESAQVFQGWDALEAGAARNVRREIQDIQRELSEARKDLEAQTQLMIETAKAEKARLAMEKERMEIYR